jgi:RHS repeat-associated protein
LGRRIQTKFVPYKNGAPEEARTITQTSLYDPEVEFLELGIVVKVGAGQPRAIWKIYGAGNNGIYGENNGYYSGFEGVVENETAAAYGITNGLNGNIAFIKDDTNKVFWEPLVYSSYGPIDPPSVLPLEKANSGGDLAKAIIESSIWQGRRVDPTGFINFGARYYDPLISRFLSCDPLGHKASADLYSYADGDPVNYIDSDGRFASEVYDYYKTQDYSWEEIKRETERMLQASGPLVGGMAQAPRSPALT